MSLNGLEKGFAKVNLVPPRPSADPANQLANRPSASTAEPRHPHFRLLDLPRELRLMIYEAVLVSRSPVYIRNASGDHPRNDPPSRLFSSSRPTPIATPLLRVSKQIYAEAGPIVWRANELAFTSYHTFSQFVHTYRGGATAAHTFRSPAPFRMPRPAPVLLPRPLALVRRVRVVQADHSWGAWPAGSAWWAFAAGCAGSIERITLDWGMHADRGYRGEWPDVVADVGAWAAPGCGFRELVRHMGGDGDAVVDRLIRVTDAAVEGQMKYRRKVAPGAARVVSREQLERLVRSAMKEALRR
ncbi:hypothetical protein SLS58_007125 [Diplodia intermedia]|uniref:Uncharacterized protein n=1 Tax=Diplodia intermedia TaxID=856260 RepID=A0ABR3TKW0_9PEZI